MKIGQVFLVNMTLDKKNPGENQFEKYIQVVSKA
jgi:hypothetical protein